MQRIGECFLNNNYFIVEDIETFITGFIYSFLLSVIYNLCEIACVYIMHIIQFMI